MAAMETRGEAADWSDAARSLLRAPTVDRVERHARDLLSRALNGGRVVGFVGAGASMAYGRLSWRDLVLINQDRALHDASASSDPSVIALRKLLEAQKIKADGTSNSEEFLPAFQLTEQLSALQRAPANQRESDQRSEFRSRVAELVVDDHGHLHSVLAVVLEKDKAPSVSDLAKDKWAGIRHASVVRSLCDAVDRHRATSSIEAKAVTDAVRALVPDEQAFTRPYHRFVIAPLLALLQQNLRLTELDQAVSAAGLARPTLRADLIAHERDPLRLMLDLRIGRFLTTNYDREIERLLADEGFVHLSDGTRDDPGGKGRKDLLAPGSRDMVFDSAHTGHLFAFAAHARRREATVVHLHGRADRPEPLIVTEDDYQRRYLAEHGNRSLMEDSLRAAFTSSPLLFVGSGLGEDELVRPLRQFVHDPTVGAGRTAVALLPMRSANGRAEQAAVIRNLQRYGVHTVHYGYVETEGNVQKRWLGQFVNYLGNLRKSIAALRDPIAALSPDNAKVLVESAGKLDAGKAKERALRGLPDIAEQLRSLPGGGAPRKLEGIDVDLYPGIEIGGETTLLVALVDLIRSQPDLLSGDKFAEAVDLCLTGIGDSITGAFLCARLIRVHRDWSAWRDGWLRVTEPEDPSNAIRDWSRRDSKDPFRRHHVQLPSADDISYAKARLEQLPLGDAALIRQDNRLLRQRFDARAYSPTFLSLHRAMRGAAGKLTPPHPGRRIVLLVTHRGVGKGHFATALAEDAYFNEFLEDLGAPPGNRSDRWPAAMFNLSFSHEVSSTFDQLTAFLHDRGMELGGEDFKPCAEAADRLKADRLARLEIVLRGWGEHASSFSSKRAIIVFNRVGALFDEDGVAKNAQTGRLFELLTGAASEDAPIDLVLLCSDRSIPKQFRRAPPGPPSNPARPLAQKVFAFVELREDSLSEKAERELSRRMEVFEQDPGSRCNFVHILRPARAILLATSYFPSVAMAIALDRSDAPVPYANLHKVFSPASAFDLRMNVRAALEKEDPKRISPRQSFPVLLAAAAERVRQDISWQDLPAGLLATQTDRGSSSDEALTKALISLGFTKDTNKEVDSKIFVNSKKIDQRFKELFEACGGGRFAFTLLMACAYHYLLPIAEARALPPGTTFDDVEIVRMRRALDQSLGFLGHMQRTLDGLPRSRRDDLLLERVLDAYRGMHETPRFPLPAGLAAAEPGMALFDLMHAILWHLSVIGQPVVTDVLVDVPAIAKAARLTAIKAKIEPEAPLTRDDLGEIVVDALFLLEFRCLVFELHSSHLKPAAGANQHDGQRRWAVHRLMQRHVFLTLRAPYVDYADTDHFALTLLNSMPNDVPRLTATSYRRLFGLVAALSAYPEPETEQVGHSAWLNATPDLQSVRARTQLLRAALGVVRAALSVSTLLRLDTREPDPSALPASYGTIQRGVLDEHRLMLLWLLEQADRLSLCIEDLDLNKQESIQRPFYAEEIVWLHNEIATVALIQGRMADAVAQYNRADDAARRFLEPAETSPLRLRIALNRASADIGRGRLRQADAALRRLIGVPGEHPAIGPIARSVLALVQHLRGRKVEAARDYEKAADELLPLQRSRASAWVLRHHGDMLRNMPDMPAARRQLDQAYTFAVEGNHEDLRHLVILSYVRLQLREASVTGASAGLRRDQHRKLNEAEAYGRVMGIAALQCEVAIIRTELHILDGDLKTAASVAGAGLAMASANDMQIRTTSLLLALCEIYVMREQYDEARPLLDAALRLANATEYHSAHQRAAELLARMSAVTRLS